MRKRNCIAAVWIGLLLCLALLPIKARAVCAEHSLYQADYALPTCTENGYYTLKCYSCDYTETVITPMNGHSWETIHINPATCTQDAASFLECSECGKQTTQTIPNSRTGHQYSAWQTDVLPTCAKPGEQSRTCGKCGSVETAEVPPTGQHSFGPWMVLTPANCMDEGIKARECDCGYTERAAIPVTDHVWEDGIIGARPTTSSEGFMLYVCSVCGMQRTQSIPKLTAEDTAEPAPTTSQPGRPASSQTETKPAGTKPAGTKPAETKPASEPPKQEAEKPTRPAGNRLGKKPAGPSGESKPQENRPDHTAAEGEKTGLPVWAICLIAVGAAGAAAAAGFLVILARKRKQTTGG